MKPIAEAVAEIMGHPSPVLFLDTCILLDVVRAPYRDLRDVVRTAVELRTLLANTPPVLWLVVGELVRQEWADNIDSARKDCDRATDIFAAVADAAARVGLLVPPVVTPLALTDSLRQLAADLLRGSIELERDGVCRERAVERVVQKRRPSHKNEVKDSILLEQYLECARQLRAAGLTRPIGFISSNKADFAATQAGGGVHPDLEPEFVAVKMDYFTSITAAVGSYRATGAIP
jgi:hypothetical protein